MRNKRLFLWTLLLWMSLPVAAQRVQRVEPLSWWTGMKTDLQLMVYGEGIGACDQVRMEGGCGVKVTGVHRADSPNYLFVDVKVGRRARPGTYTLVLRCGDQRVQVPYEIAERPVWTGQSFSTEDLVYLIVPDRFANGDPRNDQVGGMEPTRRDHPDGRHGGDLAGLAAHLDYLADLGVTALWPTPLLEDNDPRGSYHGYACSDYYHIDPRFGTNEAYRALVADAHAHGIKMLMDVVTNHCGTSHWWMADLPFTDWIHPGTPYVGTNHVMSLAMDPNAAKGDRAVMTDGWFVPSMPDMNLDNPFVLKYFQQWAVWWVSYAGLDGYRVDTWFYNEKEPMSRWARAVTDEYPGINIVGEVWNLHPDQVAYWQKDHPNSDGFNSQLPSIMDFPLRDAMNRALSDVPLAEGYGPVGDLRAVYDALSHDFVYQDLSHMLVFLSNHDTARIGDIVDGDPARMKLALVLLATLRGIPQLFYGDEMMFRTGEARRQDGLLRMDFPGGWAGDPVNLFTPEGRAADPQADELFRFARTLFRWRKTATAVQHGATLHFLPENNTYGYFRYDDTSVVLVFLNRSDAPALLPWTRYHEMTGSLGAGTNVLTGETVVLSDQTVVPAGEALVVSFRR